MKPSHLRLVVATLVAALFSPWAAAIDRTEVRQKLAAMPTAHPRILLNAETERALKQRLTADPVLQSIQAGLLAEADRQLVTKPVERVLIGRRLLDKSRTALSRVLHLGLAWRLTGQARYLERGRAELTAVAAFPNWNPSHFLDVAEMTAAVAIGYDWFYPALDEPTRTLLRTAIVEKGLNASLTANAWTRATNNWNQVCNAGITLGALAVAENEAELSADLITRAINTVPRSMHEFAPDGAYPEGPGYWGYGTSFNVLLISALESALGTDFGLSAQPGFLATADYYLHVIGPSGYYFNYSDAGRGGPGASPAMFWFAARRHQPYLLWNAWPGIEPRTGPRAARGRDRLDPLTLLWIAPQPAKPAAPAALSWSAGGPNPVAFHRSAWERDASFVAIKGGSPSLNHAHMDVGAFVMDAMGLRWADDLGSQDYNSLEKNGVDLWNKAPGSERWSVFRIGTASHNVLQIDGRQQNVAGHAALTLTKPGRTVVNLTETYAGQLAAAHRGVTLQSDRSVRVQDEFRTLDRPSQIRWAMVTRADVSIDGPGAATLKQGGKALTFRVLEPAGAKLEIYPTDPPPGKFDARNEGTRLIGFAVQVAAHQTQRLVVQLVPGAAQADQLPITPLEGW